MRKTLWEVKSILNKREKHLRGRHDQRDHNRWPAGYQAQTYTPSGRRAAVMQGRSSGSLSSMAAPPKGKLPAGVVQTSMFDEPFIAPVVPDKSQREQLLDDIRGKSRAMYARTDEFIKITDRIEDLTKQSDSEMAIAEFFRRVHMFSKNFSIDVGLPKWYESSDFKNLRQKMTDLGTVDSDEIMQVFDMLSEFHRYQEELAEKSKDLTNSIKSFTVMYKEKHEEARQMLELARDKEVQYKKEIESMIKDARYGDNAEEKNLSEKFSSAQARIDMNYEKIFAAEKELVDARERLQEVEKEEKRRQNLRKSGTVVVGGMETSSIALMMEVRSLTDEIAMYKTEILEMQEIKDTVKSDFIKINSDAQKKLEEFEKEQHLLYVAEYELREQYRESAMYMDIFSAMKREDGLENITINGLHDRNIFPAIKDREDAENLVQSLFGMMPKYISNRDIERPSMYINDKNVPTYGYRKQETEIEDVTIDFKYKARGRAQQKEISRFWIPNQFKAKSEIELTSSSFSTLTHEVVHAIQMTYGKVFWMHVIPYIHQKTGMTFKDSAKVKISTLNSLTKKNGKNRQYESYEKGYDAGLSDEYILKVYESYQHDKYTELQEIHTQAITNLMSITDNPDSEILDYFIQSVLGMPSTGHGIAMMYKMIMQQGHVMEDIKGQ